MKELNPLTGLRGVAAFSVLVAHSISGSFVYNGVNQLQPFAERLAYFSMSLFFILSGFVIHYNYAKLIKSEGLIEGGRQFIIARFARLFPLYALIVYWQAPHHVFHHKNLIFLAYVTLTQSWFNVQNSLFPPAWSISTEWFFYLAFLLLLYPLEKIKKPALTLCLFTIAVFFLMPSLLNMQTDFASKNAADSGWIIYFSPYTRVFEFIAGTLASMVYLSRQNQPRKHSPLITISTLVCIGWIMTVIFFNPIKGKYAILLSNFIYAPAVAPLLIIFCRFDSIINRALTSRTLMFMGEISYSVYLLQFWVIGKIVQHHVAKEANIMAYFSSIIKMGIIMGITTVLAYMSYRFIEKPSRRWIRQAFGYQSKRSATSFTTQTIAPETP